MKSKLVDTIISNEDHIRFRIFDGELSISAAGKELIKIAMAELVNSETRHNETRDSLKAAYKIINLLRKELEDKI